MDIGRIGEDSFCFANAEFDAYGTQEERGEV